MRIAVGQFAATTDVAANTAQCVDLIDQAGAAGADLLVLPEFSMFFDPRRQAGPGPHGQRWGEPFADAIAGAAARAQIAVLVGMLERPSDQESGGQPARGDASGADARDYNTLLAVSATGDLLGTYRKIHLYDAFGFRESDDYLPGEITEPVTFTVGDVTVGVATCYDLRFPEIFRRLVDAGADVIAVPAAWIVGPAKEHHWATLIAARAIENTVYVAASGQTGPVCCGQSMVLDPMGTVIAGAGEHPGLVTAGIVPGRIDQVRSINPSLANRRFRVVER